MERYQGLFEPDRETGGYVVTLPDFGYGVTQGETEDEAMEMARDLLMLNRRGLRPRREAAPNSHTEARLKVSPHRSYRLAVGESGSIQRVCVIRVD